MPESTARMATRIAQVGARYGFGYIFGRRLRKRRDAEPGHVGVQLRLALAELGPTFAELGRDLSAYRDALPPDVAEELARVAAPPQPVSFAEVRTIVEAQLENVLERLFVSFDETPVRAGAFTQAHRALLPGERAALVVIERPGLRRELLAMRPVADLVRIRLGDRLPVNPSSAVAEFISFTRHRRDMYAAAQTTRRLGEAAPEDLRIPQIYRDYSTGACITLEAPPEWDLPGASQRAEAGRALVRIALSEGIFLADTVPERFAAADGRLWLADPTESLSLDPERMRGIAEVLAAVGREDTEGVIRALPLTGGTLPAEKETLQRELRDTMGALGGPLWRQRMLEEISNRGLDALRLGGAGIPADIARFVHALTEAEKLGGEAMTEDAAEAARGLIRRHRDPSYIVSRAARRLAQPDTYAEYPRQLHTLLNELKDGEVEVRFRHSGLDELISKVDILANRLVFALLIAALIVGSSLLGIFSDAGARLLGVSVFGLLGFTIAALLGLALLVGIIRSGRL